MPDNRNLVVTEHSEHRRKVMRAVRSQDTRPEMAVRRMTHGMGYRYRLHRKDLPGKPDLAFFSRRKAIFVHGCFWHRHHCSRGDRTPKSRQEYWIPKLRRNRQRDIENQSRFLEMGWSVLVIWECQVNDPVAVRARIRRFLER